MRREEWQAKRLVTHWAPVAGSGPDVTACGLPVEQVADLVRGLWHHVTCQRCLRCHRAREARA